MSWKPDEALVTDAREAIEDSLRCLSEGKDRVGEDQAVLAATVLEASGTLAFLGLEEVAREATGDHEELLASFFEQVIEGLDIGQLVQASVDVLTLTPELQLVEDEELPALEERIVETLGVRDRVELIIEGARVVLGSEPELPAEVRNALSAFDRVLEKELWRLLPLGSRRAALSMWAAPDWRPRLWWWHRGSDLPYTALTDLDTAARVIHVFPEAREELERLLQATRDLDDIVRAGPPRADVAPVRPRLFPHAENQLAAAGGVQDVFGLLSERGDPGELFRDSGGRLEVTFSVPAGTTGPVQLQWESDAGNGSVDLSRALPDDWLFAGYPDQSILSSHSLWLRLGEQVLEVSIVRGDGGDER